MKRKKVQFPDYVSYFTAPSLTSREVVCVVSHIWPEDEFVDSVSVDEGGAVADHPDQFVNGKKLATTLGAVGDHFRRLVKTDKKLFAQAKIDALPTIQILDLMAECPDASPQFLDTYSKYRKKSFGAHIGWDGFDPDAPCYPHELDIAFNAWRAISQKHNKKEPIKRQIQNWLKAYYPHLVAAQIERISTLVNWEKTGGRPSTE